MCEMETVKNHFIFLLGIIVGFWILVYVVPRQSPDNTEPEVAIGKWYLKGTHTIVTDFIDIKHKWSATEYFKLPKECEAQTFKDQILINCNGYLKVIDSYKFTSLEEYCRERLTNTWDRIGVHNGETHCRQWEGR